eukprot:12290826-Karenia_brevis.AAC.1
MGHDHNNFPEAIMYAGQVISRSHQSEDGPTAWKRVFGRKVLPRKYVGWGEKVLWLPGGKRKAQAAEKWFE